MPSMLSPEGGACPAFHLAIGDRQAAIPTVFSPEGRLAPASTLIDLHICHCNLGSNASIIL